mmetsp:Transcript_118263/g.339305  ORF Transcript_118263/g.339305 Transcript_118263/m.339305 type:complete len:406 (-) Transcript_118263:639-1856(-)
MERGQRGSERDPGRHDPHESDLHDGVRLNAEIRIADRRELLLQQHDLSQAGVRRALHAVRRSLKRAHELLGGHVLEDAAGATIAGFGEQAVAVGLPSHPCDLEADDLGGPLRDCCADGCVVGEHAVDEREERFGRCELPPADDHRHLFQGNRQVLGLLPGPECVPVLAACTPHGCVPEEEELRQELVRHLLCAIPRGRRRCDLHHRQHACLADESLVEHRAHVHHSAVLRVLELHSKTVRGAAEVARWLRAAAQSVRDLGGHIRGHLGAHRGVVQAGVRDPAQVVARDVREERDVRRRVLRAGWHRDRHGQGLPLRPCIVPPRAEGHIPPDAGGPRQHLGDRITPIGPVQRARLRYRAQGLKRRRRCRLQRTPLELRLVGLQQANPGLEDVRLALQQLDRRVMGV